MRIDIEFATASDAAEISELSGKYVEHGLRRMYPPRRIRDLLRNPDKNVIAARGPGALVGFAIMTYKEDGANLDLLAVRQRFRRRGVGQQLVQWLEEVARVAGIANVFVQVRERNTDAIRFYQALGFRIIDQTAGYYQGRETAVIMCKGLQTRQGTRPAQCQ